MNIQNPPTAPVGRFCGAAVSHFLNHMVLAKMTGLRPPVLFVALMLLLQISTLSAGAQNRNSAAPQGSNRTANLNNSGGAGAETKPNDGAAAGGASSNAQNGNQQDPKKPKLPIDLRVTEVYNLRNGEDGKKEAGLDEIIIVRVKKLEALIDKAKCQGAFTDDSCQQQEIALFIDGRIIKGLEPESGAPTLDDPQATTTTGSNQDGAIVRDGTLRYHLRRDPLPPDGSDEDRKDNEEHWADLLGLNLGSDGWQLEHRVDVSVGLANEDPIATDVKSGKNGKAFYLIRMHKYRLIFWTIFTFVCIYVLIRLARESDILRDRAPVVWGNRKPYSLSAFQATWWFVLILISFIFIWLVTGQYNLSSTALILLGIGLGTGLGATVIDSNKRATSTDAQTNSDELNTLLLQKQELETNLNEQAKSANKDEFNKTKVLYNAKIADIQKKFPNAIGPPHERFYLDILSDASGVSFHRFQMLAWTIVLGIFFIYAVLGRLTMPQFSETLLLLMGVSAGTYLGFKIPENNNLASTGVKLEAAGGGNNKPGSPSGGGAATNTEGGSGEATGTSGTTTTTNTEGGATGTGDTSSTETATTTDTSSEDEQTSSDTAATGEGNTDEDEETTDPDSDKSKASDPV